MKKSEIIQKLESGISLMVRLNKSPRDIADYVLLLVESKGMLPPNVTHYRHNPNPVGNGPYFEPHYVSEWEPENE